ncbi:LamB/YcsF family protein [Chryseotalea sanaruensis]|uniref:LamB/YcsF family protein n=1 Tax=Chryseotalea sanaruensis TaxID=2482724 RepID=A0A401UCP6_9BACT|nr:5-oxoprolinase subunit PxpA [Chryseotalea sanaruensis]GCC52657.1 LamB/YcsF family protein [Chryseotalea sanaruensis]
MTKLSIDLNCDLGEGMPNDKELMTYISSANIACGYHAGDEDTMQRTIEYCLQHKVAIGAHPGFRDKENFGRTEIQLSNEQLYDLISEQIVLMQNYCKTMQADLHHIKLHGALYNMSAKSERMSEVVAQVIKDLNPNLIVYGLSGGTTITQSKMAGLKVANEVFADRTYQDNGTLTPRTEKHALISDQQASLQQVMDMVLHKKVLSNSGKEIQLEVDTICLHGDGAHALTFAKAIHAFLISNHIHIQAPQLD